MAQNMKVFMLHLQKGIALLRQEVNLKDRAKETTHGHFNEGELLLLKSLSGIKYMQYIFKTFEIYDNGGFFIYVIMGFFLIKDHVFFCPLFLFRDALKILKWRYQTAQ